MSDPTLLDRLSPDEWATVKGAVRREEMRAVDRRELDRLQAILGKLDGVEAEVSRLTETLSQLTAEDIRKLRKLANVIADDRYWDSARQWLPEFADRLAAALESACQCVQASDYITSNAVDSRHCPLHSESPEPPSPPEPTYPLIDWRKVLDESQKVDARDTIPTDGIDYEPPSEPPSDPAPKPVVDLMAALEKSVADAKAYRKRRPSEPKASEG